MADCDKPVGDRAVSYPCNLTPGHYGPCSARENAKSVRIRREWEDANPRTLPPRRVAPAPGPRVPGALERLGMQGPPKTSVDGLTAGEGRDSRREHPEERRRRLSGDDSPESLENRLVQNAGGVHPDEMASLGMTPDDRYEVYERAPRPPGVTRSEDFAPTAPIDPFSRRPAAYDARDEAPAPAWEAEARRPSILDEEQVYSEEVPLTTGERIIEILIAIQAGLNEIALIVADEG
jgi:hypothetical protein